MIRVMFLPLNYGDVIQSGVYDAFRQAGCQLEIFDYFMIYMKRKNSRAVRDDLINRVRRFRPHLLHMQIQHTTIIDARTIAKIKADFPETIVTNWTGDVRNYVPPTFRRLSDVSDFNLISSTGQLDLFEKATGRRPLYWQIGYNPRLCFPAAVPNSKFLCDAIFIGHHNTRENYPGAPTRLKACQILRRDLKSRFHLYGSGWPRDLRSLGSMDQRKVNTAYHNSACCISISHYNELNHYFSDRLLMCMASGRPTISLSFPNWESYFIDGCDLMIADNVNEIPSKVKFLVENPDVANYIGSQGAAKVYAEHTYLSRIKELLSLVGLQKSD